MESAQLTDKTLAVFDTVRAQSAWEELPAAQLATEVQALIPALQEALAGSRVEVGPAPVSQGILILTAPQLHRRHMVVGIVLARELTQGIPPHNAHQQLRRELRSAIENISAVSDPVGF